VGERVTVGRLTSVQLPRESRSQTPPVKCTVLPVKVWHFTSGGSFSQVLIKLIGSRVLLADQLRAVKPSQG